MKRIEWMTRRFLGAAALAFVATFATAADAAPNEQYFPLIGWRTGPLAVLGVNVAAGWIDYMDLLNKRDGGNQRRQADMGRMRDGLQGRSRRGMLRTA